jgi:hypothetical protein
MSMQCCWMDAVVLLYCCRALCATTLQATTLAQCTLMLTLYTILIKLYFSSYLMLSRCATAAAVQVKGLWHSRLRCYIATATSSSSSAATACLFSLSWVCWTVPLVLYLTANSCIASTVSQPACLL